jgi:hypothetical protein
VLVPCGPGDAVTVAVGLKPDQFAFQNVSLGEYLFVIDR